MLIIHGARDLEVPHTVAEQCAAIARDAGGKVTTLLPANGFHSFLMIERPGSEVNALVRAFIAAHPRR
jgi:alpha-beta hydrolase superfamily lysophospholipase